MIRATQGSSLVDTLRAGIRELHPAYFSIVMATGIIAIASYLEGIFSLATYLTYLNLIIFAVVSFMMIARLALYPHSFMKDFLDHTRGVGFFTSVAATGIVGCQLILILKIYEPARVLWFIQIALWIVLTYGIFTGLAVKESKPNLGEGINGGWLLAVVAAQAVSALGVQLLPVFPRHHPQIVFFCLALWLFGGMLYIWMISLIFYRYMFFRFSPADLMPPYWIGMGAMAISVWTGGLLIENASRSFFLPEFIPFLKGFTVFFWATATWWIPMLVLLGLWRHAYKRFKFAYDSLYWGLVFPLGMYTASTFRLAKSMNLPFMLGIPRYFIYVALVAWCVVFIGLIHRLISLGFGVRPKILLEE